MHSGSACMMIGFRSDHASSLTPSLSTYLPACVLAPTPARTQSCTPSPSRARHEGRALETPPSSPPSLSTCVPVGSDAGSHTVMHSEPVTSPSRRTHTRGTSEPDTVAIYLSTCVCVGSDAGARTFSTGFATTSPSPLLPNHAARSTLSSTHP